MYYRHVVFLYLRVGPAWSVWAWELRTGPIASSQAQTLLLPTTQYARRAADPKM